MARVRPFGMILRRFRGVLFLTLSLILIISILLTRSRVRSLVLMVPVLLPFGVVLLLMVLVKLILRVLSLIMTLLLSVTSITPSCLLCRTIPICCPFLPRRVILLIVRLLMFPRIPLFLVPRSLLIRRFIGLFPMRLGLMFLIFILRVFLLAVLRCTPLRFLSVSIIRRLFMLR